MSIIFGVEVTAYDVYRRFLVNVLESRFATRKQMAEAMGTSRAQLNIAIRDGRLTVDQMDGLAKAMGGVGVVLRELSVLADKMERGKVPKAEFANEDEQESPEEMAKSPLRGKRIRAQINEAQSDAPDGARHRDAASGRPRQPEQRPTRHDQTAKRER